MSTYEWRAVSSQSVRPIVPVWVGLDDRARIRGLDDAWAGCVQRSGTDDGCYDGRRARRSSSSGLAKLQPDTDRHKYGTQPNDDRTGGKRREQHKPGDERPEQCSRRPNRREATYDGTGLREVVEAQRDHHWRHGTENDGGGKECQGSQQDDPEGVRPPEPRAEQRDDQRRQQSERASGDQ